MDTLIPGSPTTLTTGYTVIYTVPPATTAVVAFIRVANVTAGAVTVSMSQVPAAGSPGVTNSILTSFPLPANDFVDMMKGAMLPAGASLQASASANNAVTIKIDCIESTP